MYVYICIYRFLQVILRLRRQEICVLCFTYIYIYIFVYIFVSVLTFLFQIVCDLCWCTFVCLIKCNLTLWVGLPCMCVLCQYVRLAKYNRNRKRDSYKYIFFVVNNSQCWDCFRKVKNKEKLKYICIVRDIKIIEFCVFLNYFFWDTAS